MRGLLLIPALIGAVLIYAAYDTDAGIRTWLHVRADLAASRARIATVRGEIEALRRSAEALETDAFAIECAIREDLELARRGEQVLRLKGSEDSNPRFP